MQEVSIIFPHQLFKKHPALSKGTTVVMIEEWLFFRQYHFHKQKLILHRASMKFYEDYLLNQSYKIIYIETADEKSDIRKCITWLAAQGCRAIHIAAVADDWLQRRMEAASQKQNITLHQHKTPAFLNTTEEGQAFFAGRKKYFQTDFYIWQRQQRDILTTARGDPAGGHWSYDADNRKRFPKKEAVPDYAFPQKNKHVQEAVDYINKHFPKNYGNAVAPFGGTLFGDSYYPVTFKEADDWLDDFLKHRFHKFGIYEDAMVADENILYHSVLSPLLNIGLLEPQHVVDKALKAADTFQIPLNSAEGFIRQIIGWREYIHIVYEMEGRRQRTTNYWQFSRKIPKAFWTGNTGIAPIDIVIKRVLQSGYTHHIERLMVLGNFMLLCEFDPHEVYRWFMEMFVDAYDWVMVPNTYGMTQFADGGLMMTKPYISGSNYILKMSNFPKGEWQQTWDALFWRFMHTHRHFFDQNPRLGMLLNTFDKWPADKRTNYLDTANRYLSSLG